VAGDTAITVTLTGGAFDASPVLSSFSSTGGYADLTGGKVYRLNDTTVIIWGITAGATAAETVISITDAAMASVATSAAAVSSTTVAVVSSTTLTTGGGGGSLAGTGTVTLGTTFTNAGDGTAEEATSAQTVTGYTGSSDVLTLSWGADPNVGTVTANIDSAGANTYTEGTDLDAGAADKDIVFEVPVTESGKVPCVYTVTVTVSS